MRTRMIMIVAGLMALGVPSAGMAQPTIVAACLGTAGYSDAGSATEGDWLFRHVDPSGGHGLPACPSLHEVGDPTGCEPSVPDPDPFAILFALECPGSALPVANSQILELRAGGDFACGSGTLTSSGSPNRFAFIDGIQGGGQWQLDWSATFTSGVGEIAGTAQHTGTGETRTLGGAMVIEDGALVSQCDDAAGAQTVAVLLMIS